MRRRERTLWIIPSTGIINSKKIPLVRMKVYKKTRILNKFSKNRPRKMASTTTKTWLIACLTKDRQKKWWQTLLFYIIANRSQVSGKHLRKYIRQRDFPPIALRHIKFLAQAAPSEWTHAWTPLVEEAELKTFIQRFNKEESICNQINLFHWRQQSIITLILN